MSTRIDPDSSQGRALVTFVRDGLGCGCPDEVLAELHVEAHPEAYRRLPVDYLIRIGGRLLIAVSRSSGWRGRLGQAQRRILQVGTAQRDREGFNRFRLVVVARGPAPPARGEVALTDREAPDDRVHLHVLTESELPDFLRDRHPQRA